LRTRSLVVYLICFFLTIAIVDDTLHVQMKRIGIIYNPKKDDSVNYCREIAKILEKKSISSWSCSAWEPETVKQQVRGTDLVITVGGDGTILRAAKAVVPEPVAILGINLGKLGFMSEITADEVGSKLTGFLNGDGWIEERAMLEVTVISKGITSYALNDVFLGRRSSARLVTIECNINKQPLTVYRVDGVIVATASGSTGYSLAAGGPILHPQSRDIVLQPVAAHFSFDKPLVLSADTVIDLTVMTTHEAMISIDGQIEWQLNNKEQVEVKLSKHITRFLRFQPGDYFYKTLESKLNRKVS
jgi:NAD+ kinase